MNASDIPGGGAVPITPWTGAEAPAEGADQSTSGKIHAVPVRDIVPSSGPVAETLYRFFEVGSSAIAFVAALPIMLLAAILVRLDSPGPALFRHRRPGRSIKVRGRDLLDKKDLIPPPGGFVPDTWYYVPTYFTFFKFRTMYSDARTRFPHLYAYNFTYENFHRQFPTPHPDPRVTRVGKWLRKLSVDELPNLWSVVIGDVRLVGPRPEAPEVLKYYSPEEMYKFACKPGITGLAQVNGRGLLNWGETISWDLRYIQTRSVALDLKIIFLTVKHVILRSGAF
jgi:lipopolysaccharide/colanic/teichoic acid biosynthesis glycosyltransferase